MGGAHGAGVEALEGGFGFEDELCEAFGGFAIDAEVAGPVGDGGGVEGDLVADGGEAAVGFGFALAAGPVVGELAEEGGAVAFLEAFGGRGAAYSAVAADDKKAFGTGLAGDDGFDFVVGLAARAGEDDAEGAVVSAFAQATFVRIGGAAAVADEEDFTTAEARGGEQVDETLGVEPGEIRGQDAAGVEDVVGVDDDHGGG